MAKCARCRQRKAKRACPALGNDLCPACCGAARDKEVRCPPHCPHREQHKPYQDRRLLEKKPEAARSGASPAEDILRDERLAWLALHADAPLAEIAARTAAFRDADALAALEYAREKLQKGSGRLIVPGVARKPENEAGEAVLHALEACRFERSVILAGGTEGYTTEDQARVLERLILAARSFAREEPGGRAYLDRISAQFDRMRRDSAPGKVIAPR